MPPRKGCKSIVTAVTCAISLKKQQLTTTFIVTPIVIAGTTIVTAGIDPRWAAMVSSRFICALRPHRLASRIRVLPLGMSSRFG
jgi:hypothetical protein